MGNSWATRIGPLSLPIALLEAVADGDDEVAWALARQLATVVIDPLNRDLAEQVLGAGPFAIVRAVELARRLVADAGGANAHARLGEDVEDDFSSRAARHDRRNP